jgi:hypothetical protein
MECSSILSLEVNVCDMNGHDDTMLLKDLNPTVHPSPIPFEPRCRSCSLFSVTPARRLPPDKTSFTDQHAIHSLQCEFLAVSLDGLPCQYSAISNLWGSPTKTRQSLMKQQPISVGYELCIGMADLK